MVMDNEKLPESQGMIGDMPVEPEDDEVRQADIAEANDAAESPDRTALLKAKATEITHLLDHNPANPQCDACNASKMRDVKHYKGAFDRSPQEWGDLMTCDHIDSRSKNTGMK